MRSRHASKRSWHAPSLCALLCSTLNLSAASAAPPVAPTKVHRSAFGLHVLRPFQNQLWAASGTGAVRLHDANVAWKDVQPDRSKWNWDRLDKLVKTMEEAGVDVTLTLGGTPQWAAASPQQPGAYGDGSASMPNSLAEWDAYVSAVARRYSGRIKHYEMWNEPNLPKFFTGSPEQLAQLTVRSSRLIRQEDSAARIVCAGITGSYGLKWLQRYLTAGAGKICDVVAYHLYTVRDAPEAMVPLIDSVRQVMTDAGVAEKPLWNTEFGWLIQYDAGFDRRQAGFDDSVPTLAESQATNYVIRSHLVALSRQVERNYWYMWDHPSMGLTRDIGRTMAKPAQAYRKLVELMSDATFSGCTNTQQMWDCRFTAMGRQQAVLWTTRGTLSIRTPFKGRVASFFNGSGDSSPNLVAAEYLVLTETPILLTKE